MIETAPQAPVLEVGQPEISGLEYIESVRFGDSYKPLRETN